MLIITVGFFSANLNAVDYGTITFYEKGGDIVADYDIYGIGSGTAIPTGMTGSTLTGSGVDAFLFSASSGTLNVTKADETIYYILNIGAGITQIGIIASSGVDVFADWKGLRELNFSGDGTFAIDSGSFTFNGCTNLEKITFSCKNVPTIFPLYSIGEIKEYGTIFIPVGRFMEYEGILQSLKLTPGNGTSKGWKILEIRPYLNLEPGIRIEDLKINGGEVIIGNPK